MSTKACQRTDEEDDDDSSSWESVEEENFCESISQNSLVLDQVFGLLGKKDLLKCRLVSKLWNEGVLLQNNLGSKIIIKLDNFNIDKLNAIAESTLIPFCRQFTFIDFDLDKSSIIPFLKVFKTTLTSLALVCCTANDSKSIMQLLKAPYLREISITGSLPEFDTAPFRKHHLPRLNKLELSSSLVYGQVSQDFLEKLLQNSPILQSVSILDSFSLWRDFSQAIPQTNLKFIGTLKLSNMNPALYINDFEFLQKIGISSIFFKNCVIWKHFLHSLMEIVGSKLTRLFILGSQHEILTSNLGPLFVNNNLTHLTLPIDGVGKDDGPSVLQAFPNLQEFNVTGQFQTTFLFRKQKLLAVCISGACTMDSIFPTGHASEKQREFFKMIQMIPDSPKTLKIDLAELTSDCLRKIFQMFPDIEELSVTNNSRHCLEGWTGIPIKICRKISACRSFAVVSANRVQRFPSIASLKKLKQLEIGIADDPPKAEFTLIYIVYGICQLNSLEELRLTNFTMSDVAFLALRRKSMKLKACYVDGSLNMWQQFLASSKNVNIKSFVLPPFSDLSSYSTTNPLQSSKILHNVFSFLPRRDVYNSRLVSKFWHSSVNGVLHSKCDFVSNVLEVNKYLDESTQREKKNNSQPSTPNKTPRKILSQNQSTSFQQAVCILRNQPTVTNLIVRGMNKSMLEYYQRENIYHNFRFNSTTCQDRRKIIYWFYPDGNDDLVIPKKDDNPEANTIILIGSWGRKDTGLLEFLEASSGHISSIVLHGLIAEVFDLILPKLTTMMSLEYLAILPFSSHSITELNRNHLQILSNSSFALKNLTLEKLQVPPENIEKFVKSHRYTLETLNIQNHVNFSDRLSFTIPHLRILQLDEPPGALLWTTLSINQSVESVHFERSGYTYNPIKSKGIPKLELVDQDFEHSATNVLCDVNLFLECVSAKRPGVKSILQEGSDCALRFFGHFRFLTSLTLRSVHGHYGILQGIFRNFTQLEKLVFTNTTGINDEILTGFPKYLLDGVDLLNPLNFKKAQNELQNFEGPSIRNLKNLTYLSLDDQTCTDLSVIFGILRLKRLEYFSCRKWKITDISIRAVADMTAIKNIVTDGCFGISNFGIEYFHNKSRNRLGS